MAKINSIIKKNKKFIKFISFFMLLGFLISFVIYKEIDKIHVLDEIKNLSNYLTENHINYIPIHFIIVSCLICSSILLIGLILIPIYLLYESICLGFNIFTFISLYHFKGFIYGIFYLLLTKGLYLILIILIIKKIFNIIKQLLAFFLHKQDINFKILFLKNLKSIITYIILIFINDIIIYFFANTILLKLLFIIK